MSESVVAFTQEQERAAARREGSLLLAAGAGSGKTAVLVERFARAVVEDGVAPGRILAITFTERAAGELRERMRARLFELGRRESARQAEAAFVSTFHGFCARVLRAHPLQAGIEPDFRVLDEGFASRLERQAFADALAAFVEGEDERAVDLVAAYGAERLQALVVGAHAQLRSQGQLQPRLPSPRAEEEGHDDAVAVCAMLDRLLRGFGAAYTQRKRARGALDFDDLELLARDLLAGRRELRSHWSERFELLMVDEFQDSNQRQLQILSALDRDNLFTVGDELQSIYSFRHADVRLFRERDERLAGQQASLALTRNFRSRPSILAAVRRVFAERMGPRFAPLVATRERSTQAPSVELLLADKRGWERGSSALASAGAGAPPWRRAEARMLAARLAELVAQEEARPGEIVVLLRGLAGLSAYEEALRAAGLPTLAAGGSFWSHQQVADLLVWMRALVNPLDELALYSALASPLAALSSDALALLASFARSAGSGTWQAIEESSRELGELLGASDAARLASFAELFAHQRAELALRPIAETLSEAVAVSGYERWMLAREWGHRRLASVHKLLVLARSFEAQEGRDPRGFLEHALHVETALAGREPDVAVDEHADAVRLMSVHAAKGLEFPVVCVADLGREPNLRQPELLVDADGARVGLRLLDLGDPEPVATLDYEQLCEERRVAQQQEEDRILYVACTRARERLLLSGAVAFERWPALRDGVAPVAWMAPALVPDIQSLAAAEPAPASPFTVELGEGLSVRCSFSVPVDAVAPTVEERWPAPAPAVPEPTVTGAAIPAGGARERGGPLSDPRETVSYSSLAELERCGYRYYLERVLRMPERRPPAAERAGSELDPRLRGTIVHELFEAVDFARPVAPSERDVAAVARRLGATLSPRQRREIVSLLAPVLTSGPAARLADAAAARREHPFAFALRRDGAALTQEPLVTGFIDLIVRERDGTTLIVDYKSDRLVAGEQLESLVERDYAQQRLVYALAAIEDGAERVEVAHWFLERPQRWTSACFERGRREELHERLLAELSELRARGFAVSDEPHRDLCLTCPGRGGLCSWGETHTMRARSTTLAAP